MQWKLQQADRDQSRFNMYIINQYNSYGTCEVIENMVRFVSSTHAERDDLIYHCSYWHSKKKPIKELKMR